LGVLGRRGEEERGGEERGEERGGEERRVWMSHNGAVQGWESWLPLEVELQDLLWLDGLNSMTPLSAAPAHFLTSTQENETPQRCSEPESDTVVQTG
jgi:hypothetical protein